MALAAGVGRERLMLALAQAIEEHAEELAQIESLDNGKPVGLAQYVDVARDGRAPALLRGLADEDRGQRAAGDRAEHALLHRAASPSGCARRSFPGTSRC